MFGLRLLALRLSRLVLGNHPLLHPAELLQAQAFHFLGLGLLQFGNLSQFGLEHGVGLVDSLIVELLLLWLMLLLRHLHLLLDQRNGSRSCPNQRAIATEDAAGAQDGVVGRVGANNGQGRRSLQQMRKCDRRRNDGEHAHGSWVELVEHKHLLEVLVLLLLLLLMMSGV